MLSPSTSVGAVLGSKYLRRPELATLMALAKIADSTAENALKQEEKKPQYSLQLLKIVAEQSIPVQTRLAASLAFKNFVRLNYVVCLG